MKELISVIVPVYNSKETLEKCINSILEQTYANIEIILVDDGSNDGSQDICDEYSKIDERVKVLHKANNGVSAARNDGIKLSSGEFIQFVDSDDYLEKEMVDILVKTIKKDSTDIAICGYKLECIKNKMPEVKGVFSKKEILDIMLKGEREIYINQPWNRMIRSDVIKKNNIKFDENLSKGEDLIFNLEVFSKCNNYSLIEECLYNYNQKENGLCKKKRDIKFFWHNNKILWKNLKEFYEKNNAYDAYKEKINSEYIELIKENVNVMIRQYKEAKKSDKINIIRKTFEEEETKKIIKDKYINNIKNNIVVLCVKLNKPKYLYNILSIIDKMKI